MHHPNRLGLLLTLPVVGSLWLATPLARAQEETSPVFIDRVDVNVVNVEVIVTDRSGKRIVGLRQEDFELFEDGRPVEISNFYAVAREDRLLRDLDEDRALVTGEPLPPPARPPLPEEQQLNLLVYVDHFNIRPQSRRQVLDDLEGFLEDRLIQGDRVMLVGYDRRLDVVQPFTRDRELMLRGIRQLGEVATHRQLDDAERLRIMRMMKLSAEEEELTNALSFLRSYVQSARNDLRHSALALREMVRALAGLPGRKAILYVSDGLPQRPGEELYQYLNDLFGSTAEVLRSGDEFDLTVDPAMESMAEDERHLINQITREANAHQVTLYTLDARGARGASTLSAEYRTLSASPGGRLALDSIRTMNLQEPLIEMAAATGGTAVLNAVDFSGALVRLTDDFDSFYSLGYPSPHGGDGKYHTIEVRVKRPGLRVRHRGGFVDKPQVERVADRTLSSLLLDVGKNPLGVVLGFGEARREGRRYHLPMVVRIPMQAITLVPSGEVEQGRLRIFIVVEDDKGISDMAAIAYPVTIPHDQLATARGQDAGYGTELKIGQGRPKIAVGVWDELSGTESFVLQEVVVGE